MKHIISLLFLTPIFILGVATLAAQDRDRDGRRDGNGPDRSMTPGRDAQSRQEARPTQVPRPSGRSVIQGQRDRGGRPAQRSAPTAVQPKPAQGRGSRSQVEHRPSYTKPYDRQRVSRLGIRDTPQPIRERSALLRTDRNRSVIQHPQTGPKGERIRGSMIHPRKFNNRTVRNQMSIVIQPSFNQRLDQERRRENQRNRNYWHSDRGFNYNHYIDNWGYHWYGWYRGNQYFWTRNHNGRWWWYDADYDRWCYYHDNNWYWQDPYRQEDVYVYDNDNYISLNFSFGH